MHKCECCGRGSYSENMIDTIIDGGSSKIEDISDTDD